MKLGSWMLRVDIAGTSYSGHGDRFEEAAELLSTRLETARAKAAASIEEFNTSLRALNDEA